MCMHKTLHILSIYVCKQTCMYVHIYVLHTCMDIHMCMYVYKYTCIEADIYGHMCVCKYINTYLQK